MNARDVLSQSTGWQTYHYQTDDNHERNKLRVNNSTNTGEYDIVYSGKQKQYRDK